MAKARKVFQKLASLLTCPQLSFHDRLRTFYTCVGASALWCSGCWVPSVQCQQLLCGQENRWLRRMQNVRRRPTQDWVEWYRDCKREGHLERVAARLPALWHRAAASIHGWAGHLARKADGHAAKDVVAWRSINWWRDLQSWAPTSGLTGWRHPRQNWRVGWEQVLADTYGDRWRDEASRSREAWRSGSPACVRECQRRWSGPPLLRHK